MTKMDGDYALTKKAKQIKAFVYLSFSKIAALCLDSSSGQLLRCILGCILNYIKEVPMYAGH